MKHSYGGRVCMACGGKACNVSYGQLREMVEKRQMGGNAGPMAKDDAGMEYKEAPAIKKGEMKPLGRMFADGGEVKKPMPSPSPMAEAGPLLDEDKVKKMQKGMTSVFAKGGEIESKESPDEDMLMDQCAHECMEAMKKGDKMAFKDAMTALVSELMEKMGK